jgi:hypothetical protein
MTTTTRFFSQRVASGYDTYERITVARHAEKADDAYAGGAAAPKRRRPAVAS